MSTTIDQNVVEMRFDNSHFEQNVSQSMSTLNKFKQSLKFDGATKGIESVGTATEAMSVKVSHAYAVLQAQIVRWSTDAFKKVENALDQLTTAPIRTGFTEYETQINATQTILANTESKGSTIDDVNRALEELNKYADKTIYNFTEMTRNIGTFTAAGVELDTSVNAIQGIANLAAVSGSTSQQASTAMYQLSQALASGTVKLMDWNSVVNAGMGGEVFQNALKETARVHGVAIDEMIKEEGSFRETLSKGWLTADILTETLSKFTMATEGATEAEIKANREKLKSLGYTDEQIEGIFKLGNTATNAATKVKTFTQLWDVLKESAQSGWSQSWKIIVGDFKEAQALLTPLADTLTGFINKMSDARNRVLTVALAFTDPIKTMLSKLDGAGLGKIKDTIKAIGDLSDKLEYYQDVVNKVWRGDYNNHGDNPDRFDLLTADGYDWRVVQDLVNKGYQYKLTVDDIEESYKKFGLTVDDTAKSTGKLNAAQKDAEFTLACYKDTADEVKNAYKNLTDEQLKAAGLTEEEIRLFRALEKEASRLDISMLELTNSMSAADGRTLLIDSLTNFGDVITGIGKAAASAWEEIFNPPSLEYIGVRIHTALRSLKEFSEGLRLTDAATGEWTETGLKFQRIFKGVFAVLDVITTILGGGLRFALDTISKILGAFNVDILEFTALLGDALVAFRDWLFEGNALAKAFNWMIDQLPIVVENFQAWFDVFKKTPAVQKLIEAVTAIGDAFTKLTSGEINVSDFAASLGENLAKALKSLPEIAIQIGKDFIAGFQNGIGDGFGNVIKDIVDCCLSFVASFAEALGVQSPSWKAYNTATDFFQGFINGTGDMIGAIAAALQPVGEKVIEIFNSFWDFITDENGQVEWGKLFAGGSIVSFIWVLKELVGAWKGIATAFNGIAEAIGGFGDLVEGGARVLKSFSKVLDGVAWDLKATALLKMAGAIGILIAAIWVLTTIDDPSKIWRAVNVVIVLAAVLVGLSIAMDKLSSAGLSLDGKTKKLDIKGIQSSIMQIGLALLMVAGAAMMIGSMDPEQAKQGFIGLAGIAVGMVLFMAAIGGISRYSGDVTGLGGMMTKMAVAIMLLAVACKLIGMLTPEDMALGLAFITGFAAFVAALSLASRLAGQQTNRVGGMLIKLSIAAMLMVSLCKLVGALSPEEMVKGGIFAAGFTIFVAALVASTKIGANQQIAKLGGLVMSISTSLMLLVGVCKLVGMLSVDEMIKGGLFMIAFGVLLKAMVSILKIGTDQQIAKVTGTIFAITAAIGILAAVAAILGFMPLDDLAKGVAAVSILGAIMALMISSLKGAQNVKGAITSMAIAVAVMAAAAVALSFVPAESLMAAAKSMGMVMAAFALMIASLKGLKSPKLGPLLALSGVVIVLAGILALLAIFNIEGSIKTATALSILLLAFSGAVAILSIVGPMAAGATTAVGALLLLVAAIFGIVGLLGLLYQNDGVQKILADGGTAFMLLGRAIGGLIGGFIGGIGEGISGSLVGIVQNVKKFMHGLAEAAGKAAEIEAGSFDGVTDLVAVMTGVFGASVLEKLASGFLGESSIDKFATDASAFVTAIGDISESLDGVTIDDTKIQTVVKCGEYFNSLLTALPKTGGLVQTLMGEQDLNKFGISCQLFAEKMKLINDEVSGDNFQFHSDRIQALVDAGMMFTTILDALPKTNGLVQTLMGEPDLVKFSTACYMFAEKMRLVNESVSGENFQFHSDRIQLLVDAGLMFTTLLNALPKTNGLIQQLMGEQDLIKFGTSCQLFAEKMKLVNDSVSDENFQFHSDRIELLVDAGKTFNTLLTALPKSNGLIQKLMGQEDMITFANGCSAFATAMGTVSSVITAEGFSIDLDAIDTMVSAGTKFNELQNTLPQTGGWWEKVVGEQDISDFGAKVQAFGEAMGAYSTAVSELNTEKITESLATADSLKTLAESLAGVDAKGITNFAGSGLGDGYIVRIGKTMADYSEAVSELDTSVVSISVSAAMNLVDLIDDLSDLDTSGIDKFDVTTIGSAMKTYSDKVSDVDTVVVSQSISSAMRLSEFISGLTNLDPSGIGNFEPTAIGSSMQSYGKNVSGLDIKSINDSLVSATKIKNFITGLTGFNTESVESFASAIETLGGIEITKVTSTFETVGDSLATSMVNGFVEKTSKLGSTVASCITSVCAMLRLYYTSFYLNGSYLGSGLVGGINSKKKAAYNAGYALGQAAVQGEKDGQQSNSPSKLTTLAGHWLGEGLIVGMKEIGKKVYESGHDLGDKATNSVTNTVSKIADVLNSDLDVQPTIRPVIDLSDVKTGVNAISSMFGSSSMGITTNIGAVSSLMNRNGQNGRNDDIINALDKLNKKMDNIGNTTYQINGVTYDDGSNIAAAVQTITRAALRERRM